MSHLILLLSVRISVIEREIDVRSSNLRPQFLGTVTLLHVSSIHIFSSEDRRVCPVSVARALFLPALAGQNLSMLSCYRHVSYDCEVQIFPHILVHKYKASGIVEKIIDIHNYLCTCTIIKGIMICLVNNKYEILGDLQARCCR